MDIHTVISSLDPATGGPARSVPTLCKEVNNAGAEVTLFVNSIDGIKKNTTYSPPVQLISQLTTAIQKSKKSKTHPIIHNHGIWLPINHTAAVIARRYNIPHIISPRGMLEPWAFNFNKWKKKLAWLMYQRRDLQTAKVLHATATQEAESLRRLGLQAPIAIIPNGVNLPKQIKPTCVNSRTKKALFLSRIHVKKGLINLVQAWAKVSPLNWQVIIAGPDESNHKQEVEKEIDRLGLTERFSFTGPIKDNDKWALYNEADLFILPTFSENFGIVIAEALASGVPVITTKGTPWSELTQHNCGWWIDIGIEPLALAISEAISLSSETRATMGQHGRQLVIEKYSWNAIVQDMISIYEWVLHGGTPPKCVITD
jgi:glycosyltransferase involved in cell wall biosynthesis